MPEDPRYRAARRLLILNHVHCNRCPKRARRIHHVDGDTGNNHPTNHEPLCRGCYDAEHGRED